ncbi:MAG: hypothetical protein PHT88_04825 [Candidatus Moranbacteria bacterium]|nr:hypothetical protein [Candidatus Moranbacteria bacterium]
MIPRHRILFDGDTEACTRWLPFALNLLVQAAQQKLPVLKRQMNESDWLRVQWNPKGISTVYISAGAASLFVCGLNNWGQLGVGHEVPVAWEPYIFLIGGLYILLLPIPARVKKSMTQIAAGKEHSLALTANGDLYAFGRNQQGQLGLGDTTLRDIPVKVGAGFTAIAAGDSHSLALKGEDLYAFGAYHWANVSYEVISHTPLLIGAGFHKIAAGGGHGLALKAGGDLYSFGGNGAGQLGLGDAVNQFTPTFVGAEYKAIAAGFAHSLAIKANGDLYAFGSNTDGQLGLGVFGYVDVDYSYRLEPTLIGEDFSAVSAGSAFSLALKTNGDLYAFGGGQLGQLGLTDTDGRASPTLVAGGFKSISAGASHTLAIKSNGDLYSFGSNINGALGLGDYDNRASPVKVAVNVSAVAGGGEFSLLLKSG